MHLQRVARLTGLLYALNFVLGITAMVWSSHGHAVAADRMTLAGAIEYALVVLLIAWLFEGAGRAFSWTVAAIGLAGCAVGVAGALHLWGFRHERTPRFWPLLHRLGRLGGALRSHAPADRRVARDRRHLLADLRGPCACPRSSAVQHGLRYHRGNDLCALADWGGFPAR